MTSAIVTAYPRIHITLVDLAHGTGRIYGGAGFALDGLTTRAIAKKAERPNVVGPAHFQSEDVVGIHEAVDRLSDRVGMVFDVVVRCDAPSHVGLGAKTTCVLAALRACNAVAGAQLSALELVQLANRGGTSGIGVNTAFVGGFVADAGHPANPAAPLLPSSAATGTYEAPPAIVKLSVPKSWCVHLFLPKGQRVTGQVERCFFERNTPIPRWEVLEVLASLYHGVVPAFASGSLPDLICSLQRIHELGFKRREVEYQGDSVIALLRCLNDLSGLATGMSSMGPLVYAIAACASADLTAVFKSQYGSTYLGQFKARNEGSYVVVLEDD